MIPALGLFGFFFVAIFLLVIGTILFSVIKGVSQWASNNAQPVLSTDAHVVAKRQHVSGGAGDSSASTSYYMTFEFASGERREFRVGSNDYALLAESDSGRLTYQGTRFQGFSREIQPGATPPSAALPPVVRTCTYCGSPLAPDAMKCDGCGSLWRPGSQASSPGTETSPPGRG